jgi:hypothetical protein
VQRREVYGAIAGHREVAEWRVAVQQGCRRPLKSGLHELAPSTGARDQEKQGARERALQVLRDASGRHEKALGTCVGSLVARMFDRCTCTHVRCVPPAIARCANRLFLAASSAPGQGSAIGPRYGLAASFAWNAVTSGAPRSMAPTSSSEPVGAQG